ncbi:hypothetical protein KUTeg_008903 [Tegillarca granosa]|uniref:Uncharacterized protein n=1 Tax=Tegillarca granosa TaxID=220873 RepID=A0ABQ9FCZ1_TEGGR|nr:hypothetical protein KUTeg_008903 [Tegillarca granosa]
MELEKGVGILLGPVSNGGLCCISDTGGTKYSIYEPIKRNSPSTFETLYEVVQKNESKVTDTILKADRNFVRRIVTAYAAGRDIDLKTLLTHELMPVPLSLAELIYEPETRQCWLIYLPKTLNSSSCLILDGQARVLSIENPTHVKTFRDFVDVFVNSVYQSGAKFKRIDVIFDRYRQESIKQTT